MKRLLTILAFLLLASSAHADESVQLARMNPAVLGASVVCTTPSTGSNLNEGFETATTGYENSGWNATGTTIDTVATVPGTPPSGSCSQSLKFTINSANAYVMRDHGSTIESEDFYAWLYVHAGPASGDSFYIVSLNNNNSSATSSVGVAVSLLNTVGQLNLKCVAASTSSALNISADTWYKLHIHYVRNNTTPDSYCSIDGTDSTKATFNTDTNYSRYHWLGAVASATTAGDDGEFYFDVVYY